MGSRGGLGVGLMLFLALALLILPLQWVIAAVLAAAFHELCHYAAVQLCGGEVQGLRVELFGAKMAVSGLTAGKELLCALAGPLGSLTLLLAARWMPRTALCAGFHGLFNLFPVYPLDGGRALRCGAALLLPLELGERICAIIEVVCLLGVILLGVYGTLFLRLGLLPLMLAVTLAVRAFRGKIPCKLGSY